MAQLKTLVTIRLVLITISILTSVTAIADKPSWAGGGKQEKQKQNAGQGNYDNKPRQDTDHPEFDGGKQGKHKQNIRQGDYEYKPRHDKDYPGFSGGRYFIDRHRSIVHDYYFNAYQTGRCPPGLAKKHNGCMPPGQAKKWAIGRPLPRDVIFYDLPRALAMQIGPPPAGYRFVRVASDILMIAIRTGMMMDAINDLGGYQMP